MIVAAAGTGPDGGAGPDSGLRAGSLSKTFVAVMLLQLVAEARSVLTTLWSPTPPTSPIAEGVTMRQLLAHRSGIPEHTDGELAPVVLPTDPAGLDRSDVLEWWATSPATLRPAREFAYSNTNYMSPGCSSRP